MNLKMVLNTLGKMLIATSGLLTIPLVIALYFGEDLMPFIYPITISFVIGTVLILKTPESDLVRFKESFAIVGLGWLIVSLIGAIPYMVIGFTPVNAFFESISGFTTTGASIVDHPEALPKSILFWRSMTQWVGGIGIVMLFLLIFPTMAKGVVFQAEYPGITLSKIKPRIRDTAIRLYGIYVLLTGLEAILLTFLGVPIFDSINHAFTTLSTGGYSTHSESISFFKNPSVEFVIMTFAFLGGANFSIYYYVMHRNFKVLKDTEFKIYVTLTGFLIVVITLLNLKTYGLLDSLRYSSFQVICVLTTTGYTTADFDEWCNGSKMLLLILMFIGGCSGSTAGGMKVIRFYIISRYAIDQILRSAEPKVVKVIRYGETTLRREIVESVIAFFIIQVLVFTISSVVLSLSGYDILTSVSATASCLGNVGPGMGLAGASETYSHFPDIVKLLLCFDMWVGRLEIYTVLALFIPSFWK